MYIVNKDYWKVQTMKRPMYGFRFAILVQDNEAVLATRPFMVLEISLQIWNWYVESMYWFNKKAA